MNALIIGADRLGNIPEVLQDFGIRIAGHLSGRDSAHQRRGADLPAGVEMVILLTDFLGHNVMKRFREAAREQGIDCICCRRSVCELRQALDKRDARRVCEVCPQHCAKGGKARRR